MIMYKNVNFLNIFRYFFKTVELFVVYAVRW